MNFTDFINESFLGIWRDHPSATLHWMLPRLGAGFWQLREGQEIIADHIPQWVGDWVWLEMELAESFYPNPKAQECNWHLVLLP